MLKIVAPIALVIISAFGEEAIEPEASTIGRRLLKDGDDERIGYGGNYGGWNNNKYDKDDRYDGGKHHNNKDDYYKNKPGNYGKYNNEHDDNYMKKYDDGRGYGGYGANYRDWNKNNKDDDNYDDGKYQNGESYNKKPSDWNKSYKNHKDDDNYMRHYDDGRDYGYGGKYGGWNNKYDYSDNKYNHGKQPYDVYRHGNKNKDYYKNKNYHDGHRGYGYGANYGGWDNNNDYKYNDDKDETIITNAVAILNVGGEGVEGWVKFERIDNDNNYGSSYGADDYKVKITAYISGLKPGKHGWHIHEFGDITDCLTTGGHYNPLNVDHGAPEDEDRHIGDLGNIYVNDEGIAEIEQIDDVIRLNGKYSIIGRGIVIHEDEDDLGRGGDEGSRTTGNAGDRPACGVIGIQMDVEEDISYD